MSSKLKSAPLRSNALPRASNELLGGRVRKPVTRGGKGIRGKFPSLKLRRMVQYESLLERDAILLLEYNPLVLGYQEQPSVEIYYDGDQVARRYVPDFRVDLVGGGRLLIEVKASTHVQRRRVKAKLQAIALRFKETGQAFRLLTEAEIRRQPRFDNLQMLHDANKARSLEDDLHALSVAFEGSGLRSFGELAAVAGGQGPVLRQIASGQLRADLDQSLQPCTPVWTAANVEAGHGAFHI